MKIYEKKFVPVKEVMKYVETECDICGDITKTSWRKKKGDAVEVEVKMTEGTVWPEGGSGLEIEYDICPVCFKEKIIPFLESLGAKQKWREWDF